MSPSKRVNPWEESNRQKKVFRIVLAIEEAAFSVNTTPADLVRYLVAADEAWWRSIAATVGVSPPSDTTIGACIHAVRERAKERESIRGKRLKKEDRP
jgi:hypothetical protein